MKNFNIDQFISSVPVLRLFGKNLALNAGIAFVIQDFLIPLYSGYIFNIVIGLAVFGFTAMAYWFLIYKSKKKEFCSFFFSAIYCMYYTLINGWRFKLCLKSSFF